MLGFLAAILSRLSRLLIGHPAHRAPCSPREFLSRGRIFLSTRGRGRASSVASREFRWERPWLRGRWRAPEAAFFAREARWRERLHLVLGGWVPREPADSALLRLPRSHQSICYLTSCLTTTFCSSFVAFPTQRLQRNRRQGGQVGGGQLPEDIVSLHVQPGRSSPPGQTRTCCWETHPFLPHTEEFQAGSLCPCGKRGVCRRRCARGGERSPVVTAQLFPSSPRELAPTLPTIFSSCGRGLADRARRVEVGRRQRLLTTRRPREPPSVPTARPCTR